MHHIESYTGTETCITAGKIFVAFFLFTAFVQIAIPGTQLEQLVIVLAGAIALAVITSRWIRQPYMRRHLANLSLLAVAFLIGLDMAAALTDR